MLTRQGYDKMTIENVIMKALQDPQLIWEVSNIQGFGYNQHNVVRDVLKYGPDQVIWTGSANDSQGLDAAVAQEKARKKAHAIIAAVNNAGYHITKID
jgi:hypothetical protein